MSLFFSLLASRKPTSGVFGFVGDSNMDGRGDTITSCASDTLYLWGGASFSEVTTGTTANGGSYGSIAQKMATDIKALTGLPVYLVNGASGASTFYPNGDNNNWETTGTLYSAFITELDQALTNRGALKPDGIIVNLGINDARSANATSDIKNSIDSFFSRITAKYPNVPILVIVPGRSETTAFNTQRYYEVRAHIIQKAKDYTDVHILCNAGQFIGISGMYKADDLHYSQTMNDAIAAMIGRWYTNTDISNKWARTLISSHHDVLNDNRKNLINQLVTNQYNNDNYFKLETLLLFKQTTVNNIFIDWTFVSYGLAFNSPTFTDNDSVETNGTTSFLAMSYINQWYNRSGAGQNDFIVGVKLKTRTTSSGVSGILFGRTGSAGSPSNSSLIRVAQSTTNVNYHNNVVSGDLRNASGETALAQNTLHSTARNGTTEYYLKGTTIIDTHPLASDGSSDAAPLIGAGGPVGSPGGYLAASYEYAYAAKYDGFDLSSFVTDIEYLIAHWND